MSTNFGGYACAICGSWVQYGMAHACLGWWSTQARPSYPPTTLRCRCLATGEGTVTIRKPDREVTYVLCRKHLDEAEQAAMAPEARKDGSSP